MLASQVWYRLYIKDRVFVTLLGLNVLSFVIAALLRHPSFETSALPFELWLLFFVINIVFAFVSHRREPLLTYMFFTIGLINSIVLIFFFRYLMLIQAG